MPDQAPTSESGTINRPWWETRPFVALLILISAVPLLYPSIPPLVDLMGHMGRYRVELALATSPWLEQYYGFHWAAIGNLGVDILVIPLSKIFGLELAVKLIVLVIPPLTVAGFLWVAREVHGRIPPTALFALPFAYSHPLMFGFVNFALSIAFAFLAFGLWLRLARLGRLKLRAILFVPISLIVFFTHTFGWGVLGLLCFSGEAVRQHDSGNGWFRSGINAALHASVMALPLLFVLAWRSSIHGGRTGHWFDFELKWKFFFASLRDRWKWFDVGAVTITILVMIESLRQRQLTFSRNLVFSALVLFVGFLLLPYLVFSSAYADMRMIPYVIAVLLLAIRFRGETRRPLADAIAVLGLAFFIARIAGNTVSLGISAHDQEAKLRALDQVPMGARVLSLVHDGCGDAWSLPRNTHLGAMTIVRRQGFSNDQWVTAGLNLLSLRYLEARPFTSDPSQIVRVPRCTGRIYWDSVTALRAIPPGKFDYLWLIDFPPFDPRLVQGIQPVWSASNSTLYRLPPPQP
ncbi:hypothetical protein [Sphingomonas sp.]|uniref:hypothetical protein n=1 Tax=Sphingomonas sp. TaxID=28214 RepID=UPI00286C813B|nr:hypothetical protein [Sphingomonas sp.]